MQRDTFSRTRLWQIGSWSLGLVVCGLAFIKWGQDYAWQLGHLTVYQVFPLLGLLAFSLMWTHYIIGTLRDLARLEPEALRGYYRWTGYAVLALVSLHPGLLVFQRFIDGFGLPPGSYKTYVAPGLAWVTLLGTASLLVFWAFEFHRVYGKRSWWHYVVDASDLAMLAIVYHGLRLGSQLQQGWYRYIWWFYAITLTIVLVRKYSLRFLSRRQSKARP